MSRFKDELEGKYGDFWKKSAEAAIAEVREDYKRMIVDNDGAAKWQSNGQYIMDDLAEVVEAAGLYVNRAATETKRKEQDEKFIESYRNQSKSRTAVDPEELYEMKAAFGSDEIVVDVISGKKTYLGDNDFAKHVNELYNNDASDYMGISIENLEHMGADIIRYSEDIAQSLPENVIKSLGSKKYAQTLARTVLDFSPRGTKEDISPELEKCSFREMASEGFDSLGKSFFIEDYSKKAVEIILDRRPDIRRYLTDPSDNQDFIMYAIFDTQGNASYVAGEFKGKGVDGKINEKPFVLPLTNDEVRCLSDIFREYGEANKSRIDFEGARFLMEQYSFPEGVYDFIKNMHAKEKSHFDEKLFHNDVVLEITKDEEFKEGESEYNIVTIDFKIDGKSVASTYDIHVSELEDVITDILHGDKSYLADENRTLKEIFSEHKKTNERGICI